jgi:DNA-binding transcriptional LysR family regulator
MLDLYKLQIFETVVEQGSFSAAAQRLMMSQSGVSQHIRDVESALGTRLFERSRRGAEPTESGRLLYDYSQRILGLVSQAENAVTDVANLETGHVHVEATPGISIYVLSGIVQAFRNRYPRLSVSLETRITPEIVQDILARRTDLGIVEGEMSGDQASELRVVELESIPQYVVVGQKHAFWNRTTIEIDELDGCKFIMRQPASQSRIWLEETLARHGISPRVNAEFDNVESIKRTLASGDGLAVLPRYAMRDEENLGTLRAVTVTGVSLHRVLKLVWDDRRHFSPVERSLLEHLAEHYPAIHNGLNGQ